MWVIESLAERLRMRNQSNDDSVSGSTSYHSSMLARASHFARPRLVQLASGAFYRAVSPGRLNSARDRRVKFDLAICSLRAFDESDLRTPHILKNSTKTAQEPAFALVPAARPLLPNTDTPHLKQTGWHFREGQLNPLTLNSPTSRLGSRSPLRSAFDTVVIRERPHPGRRREPDSPGPKLRPQTGSGRRRPFPAGAPRRQ